MSLYELIIVRNQPSCGGKPSMLHQFMEVDIDDPVKYVRDCEPRAEPCIENNDDGETVFTIGEGVNRIRYVFTPAD